MNEWWGNSEMEVDHDTSTTTTKSSFASSKQAYGHIEDKIPGIGIPLLTQHEGKHRASHKKMLNMYGISRNPTQKTKLYLRKLQASIGK